MKFSVLLDEAGISPTDVTFLLHNATEEPFRSKLGWIAANRPDLFSAYQALHGSQAAATIQNRPLVASFVPLGKGFYLFAGMFRVAGIVDTPRSTIYADPRYAELEKDFGVMTTGPTINIDILGTQPVFDLQPDERLADYIGRVEVFTEPRRAYARVASNTDLEIVALYRGDNSGRS